MASNDYETGMAVIAIIIMTIIAAISVWLEWYLR